MTEGENARKRKVATKARVRRVGVRVNLSLVHRGHQIHHTPITKKVPVVHHCAWGKERLCICWRKIRKLRFSKEGLWNWKKLLGKEG